MKIPPRKRRAATLSQLLSSGAVPKTSRAVLRILDQDHPVKDATLDASKLADRVVAFAQLLTEKRFYPPQVALSHRIIESALNHDGAAVTALFSRQSGKTECVGATCAAIALIFPYLAALFLDDWHLNITDQQGVYRGYRNGISVGIYGPKQEQAATMFERVRMCLESDTARQVLTELRITDRVANGQETKLSNNSSIICQSASEQSKIEGATHHILVLEEAQDISDRKVRKSLHPMTASVMGTIVKVGTATGRRCDFYESGQANIAEELAGGCRNHFVFPANVCSRSNSLYAKYVMRERARLGEDSDEFRMSYACLAGDTPVTLWGGQRKPIASIVVGDTVLTHKGRPRKVTTVATKQAVSNMCELEFYGSYEKVRATHDHKFLTKTGWTQAQHLHERTQLLIPRPVVTAKLATVKTCSVYNKRQNRSTHRIPRVLPLTADLGELLGWYIAEGNLNSANSSQVTFSLNGQTEVAEAHRISELLASVFQLPAAIHFNRVRNVVRVSVGSVELVATLHKWFGTTASKKSLPPWFNLGPIEFLHSFLRAYFKGDGCYTKHRTANTYNASIVTVSYRLAHQLEFMLMLCGVTSSHHRTPAGNSVIDGRAICGKPKHQLYVYGLHTPDVLDKRYTQVRQEWLNKGYFLRTVKAVRSIPPESVWDIEVEEDHSFVAAGVVAKNCEWLFERGMFMPIERLLDADIALRDGPGANLHLNGVGSSKLSVVVGIDWAQMYDSTILTLLAVNWSTPIGSDVGLKLYRKHVLGWYDLQGLDYEEQFIFIQNTLSKVAGLTRVVTDSNACGAPMTARIQGFLRELPGRVDLQANPFSAQSKSNGYRLLTSDFFGKRLSYPAGPETRRSPEYRKFIKQMADLQKVMAPGGLLKVSHPDVAGAHDDYCDSLMLAVSGASSPSTAAVKVSDNVLMQGRKPKTGRYSVYYE